MTVTFWAFHQKITNIKGTIRKIQRGEMCLKAMHTLIISQFKLTHRTTEIRLIVVCYRHRRSAREEKEVISVYQAYIMHHLHCIYLKLPLP